MFHLDSGGNAIQTGTNKMANSIKVFEVGKSYSMRSACNHDCVWTYKVISRTRCTITISSRKNEQITCRVKANEILGAECCKPLGSYSMSPILSAR